MGTQESDRPVWNKSFDEESRQEQVKDDSAAWNAVTGLLLTIITIGVGLAILTFLLTS